MKRELKRALTTVNSVRRLAGVARARGDDFIPIDVTELETLLAYIDVQTAEHHQLLLLLQPLEINLEELDETQPEHP